MLCPIANKWEQLGTQFGFQQNELMEIKKSCPHSNCTEWMTTMISKKIARSLEFGWNDIVRALVNIDCMKIAETICKKYKVPNPQSFRGKCMLHFVTSVYIDMLESVHNNHYHDPYLKALIYMYFIYITKF